MQAEPLVSIWIIFASGIVLILLFSWLEWQRKTKFLWLRLSAVVLMVLSVVLYLLQPGLQREQNGSGVVVLTKNYRSVQADSLRAANPELLLVVMPDAAPYASAQEISSTNDILNYKNQIGIVMGDGLPEWALPKSYKFLKGVDQNGIINLTTPQKILANRKTTLSGIWNGEATSLVLMGPGGALDSVSVAAGTQPFVLSFKPKQTGKFLFSIKTSSTEPEELPIEVLPVRALNILLLQSYPSAETRYLKNFLIDQGHRVAMRTQVSKSEYRTEFGNRTAINLNRITQELLNEFDLVVLANETLLPKAEQGVLENSIRSGLGLLWLCTREELQKPVFGFEAIPYVADTARIQVDEKLIVLPAVAMRIKNELRSVVANSNRVLSGYKVSGAGKIGVQLLQETYTQVVSGETEVYSLLWSPLLEELARPITESTKIKIGNSFPIYPNEPIEIAVISAQPLPEIILDSIQLPLREDAMIDNYWTTTCWATQPGWHTATSPTDSTSTSFYVSKPNAWQAVKSATLQVLNGARASTSFLEKQDSIKSVETKRISPLWFFILFLLSAGFLWLVPKL